MSTRIQLAILLLTGCVLGMPEVTFAQCSTCCGSKSCNGCDKCCRPLYIKNVYKKNCFGGGLIGQAPPMGFAVASVPAIMVQTPAFAATPAIATTAAIQVSPASFSPSSLTSAGLSADDIHDLVELRRQKAKANVSPATASSTDPNCPDPCGQIKQLETDVKDLKEIVTNLTVAVKAIAEKLPPK